MIERQRVELEIRVRILVQAGIFLFKIGIFCFIQIELESLSGGLEIFKCEYSLHCCACSYRQSGQFCFYFTARSVIHITD